MNGSQKEERLEQNITVCIEERVISQARALFLVKPEAPRARYHS